MSTTVTKIVLCMSLFLVLAGQTEAQQPKTLVAVFAHPDDERMAGPVLARYARQGVQVYLVIATDGRKGAAAHAHIPLGDSLAAVRVQEARCATRELGIHDPILLGHADAGLASFAALDSVRSDLRRIFAELRPNAVITCGPEGGTGHPDHRLVGVAVSDVVQSGADGAPEALYYPSLPTERMATAPPARPRMNTTHSKYLPVHIAFTADDFDKSVRAYACHASQYTREQVHANMLYMKHGWNGEVWFRRWNDQRSRNDLF